MQTYNIENILYETDVTHHILLLFAELLSFCLQSSNKHLRSCWLIMDPGQDDIIDGVEVSVKTLEELKDKHEEILKHLNTKKKTDPEVVLEYRINEVKRTFEEINLTVDEGQLILNLNELQKMLQLDKRKNEEELNKIKDRIVHVQV